MNDIGLNERADVLSALEETAEYNAMTDNEVLLQTRSLKLRIVSELTKDTLPSDPKDINALMKVVDSIDKAANNNIRNAIEQDSNANVSAALAIITAMEKMVGTTDPFMRDVSTGVEPRIVTLDQPLLEVQFVEGELSQEIRDLTYDSFVDDYDSKH